MLLSKSRSLTAAVLVVEASSYGPLLALLYRRQALLYVLPDNRAPARLSGLSSIWFSAYYLFREAKLGAASSSCLVIPLSTIRFGRIGAAGLCAC